jgi:ribosomal protein S15P/S13E
MKKKSVSKKKKPKREATKTNKMHSWRLCPPGEHWVRTHPLRVPPSKTNPQGSMTTRHGHCALNPTGKDQLYPDEIQEIGTQNFSKVKERPCPINLKYKNGSQYDDLIAGWTRYWNEVLEPEVPLPADLVKALIASESKFDPNILANKKDQNSARGLMQITNKTRKILADEKGELKDHFLTLTREELNDPSNNICAGIRWLFRKHAIASSRLKRLATWEEAVAEFKGTRTATSARAAELMRRFNKELEALKTCGKL